MTVFRRTYLDTEADSKGRRRFILDWIAESGAFRHELSRDGAPVGMRRGQVFFTNPESQERDLALDGHTIEDYTKQPPGPAAFAAGRGQQCVLKTQKGRA